MRCLIISPSGAVRGALDRLGLLDSSDDRTVVISSFQQDVGGSVSLESIVLSRPSSTLRRRLTRALSGTPAGRNLLRLSPLDEGRRLARAARVDQRVREAASAADLIIVTERDGVLTGWLAARTWAPSSTPAVYGIAAGEALLKAARAPR